MYSMTFLPLTIPPFYIIFLETLSHLIVWEGIFRFLTYFALETWQSFEGNVALKTESVQTPLTLLS